MEAADTSKAQAVARLAIGLAQGLALFLLYRAASDGLWPATDGMLFAPMVLVAGFVPFTLLFGWGRTRPLTLLIWAVLATLLLTGLALHDILRWPDAPHWRGFLGGSGDGPRIAPSPPLVVFGAGFLFIAQALVAAGDADRRIIAAFPTYFDTAWKGGIQLAFSAAFLGAFWGVLFLGAQLFELIKLKFLSELIEKRWFWIPASTLALALAIHITDVRPAIVRGIRGLALTLLAWLLPLLTLIVAGFLLSLPFTGLEPLWQTRYGTSVLLLAGGIAILLINAAYQGGVPHSPPSLFRHAARFAALLLVALTALAVYGLSLRVGKHGWTTDRIIAAACILVLAWHAAGYVIAAVARGPWMQRLEITNVTGAWLVLAVLLALFTPIADPARIAVSSQVARLEAGAVSWREFDYQFLRFEGARYGRAALDRLKAIAPAADADFVRSEIDAVLAQQHPRPRGAPALTNEMIAANITLHPAGRTLPADFLVKRWPSNQVWPLGCLKGAQSRCDGFFVDLDGDGVDEVVLIGGTLLWGVAFTHRPEGWTILGQIHIPPCAEALAAIRNGRARAIDPMWRDVEADGFRFRLERMAGARMPDEGRQCPKR